MMDQLIAGFPAQLKEALQIGQQATFTKTSTPIHNILVTGLGGSGMGADIVIDLLKEELSVPMLVNKDYGMPAFVNEHTLLIASSFSGNTEETMMALEKAALRNAKISCITSGGKMADFAREKGYDLIILPKGPSPRACLGYSFIQQLFILHAHGLISDAFVNQITQAADDLAANETSIKASAEHYAKQWYDKMPIIYAPDGYGSVAIRWRQQFNENSKMLCWHHIVPEMNHNELVGWRTEDANLATIFLHATDVFDRTKTRMKINKEIIQQYTPNVFDLEAEGQSKVARMLHLILLGDWISWYMAQARQMDALEVKVIDYLKGELAKVPIH